MKKKIQISYTIIILLMILLSGCGTNEVKETASANRPTITVTSSSEPSITPTTKPTPKPTATPTPELSPLEMKYQYYDPTYDGNSDFSFAGDAKSLEEELSSGSYYFTWYGYGETDYYEIIEIDEYTRNGKKYGIKCLVPTQYGILVYYLYLDDPDKIFCEEARISFSGSDYYVLVDDEGNPYASITPEEVEAFYIEPYYTPLTVQDLYTYALELAKKKISGKIYMNSALDVITGHYEYENTEDWYFEFDGNRTYTIGFNISYKRLGDSYSYYMECSYVDENQDYKLKLRYYDLIPQY